MPKRNLTDRFVKGLKPGSAERVEFNDTVVPQLVLRLTATGVKSWSMRYRALDGTQERVTFGNYPGMGVDMAREAARTALRTIAAGGSPAADKKSKREQAVLSREHTVEIVGRKYFEEAALGRHRHEGFPKAASTLASERIYFDGAKSPPLSDWTIAKRLGRRKIGDVKRMEIQTYVNAVEDAVSRSAATQVRRVLQRIYTYAAHVEIADSNPCHLVSAPHWEDRDHVLTEDELAKFWSAVQPPVVLDDGYVSEGVAYALQLALVTLQRRGQIAGMRVDEIDWKQRTWLIPVERSLKNRAVHVVPLSDLALEIIEKAIACRGRESDFVFPSDRKWRRGAASVPDAPIGAGALTQAFRFLAKAEGIKGAVPHDLRRTGSTMLTGETLDTTRFIVARVLSHSGRSEEDGPSVTAAYDRNAYLPQKRAALDAWAKHLLKIVSGKDTDPSNVIDFAKAQ